MKCPLQHCCLGILQTLLCPLLSEQVKWCKAFSVSGSIPRSGAAHTGVPKLSDPPTDHSFDIWNASVSLSAICSDLLSISTDSRLSVYRSHSRADIDTSLPSSPGSRGPLSGLPPGPTARQSTRGRPPRRSLQRVRPPQLPQPDVQPLHRVPCARLAACSRIRLLTPPFLLPYTSPPAFLGPVPWLGCGVSKGSRRAVTPRRGRANGVAAKKPALQYRLRFDRFDGEQPCHTAAKARRSSVPAAKAASRDPLSLVTYLPAPGLPGPPISRPPRLANACSAALAPHPPPPRAHALSNRAPGAAWRGGRGGRGAASRPSRAPASRSARAEAAGRGPGRHRVRHGPAAAQPHACAFLGPLACVGPHAFPDQLGQTVGRQARCGDSSAGPDPGRPEPAKTGKVAGRKGQGLRA